MTIPRKVYIFVDEDRQHGVKRHWVIEDSWTGESLAAGFFYKTDAEAYAQKNDMRVMNPSCPAEED